MIQWRGKLTCPGCGTQRKEGMVRWVPVRIKVKNGESVEFLCESCGPLAKKYMKDHKLRALSLRRDLGTAIGHEPWRSSMVALRGSKRS